MIRYTAGTGVSCVGHWHQCCSSNPACMQCDTFPQRNLACFATLPSRFESALLTACKAVHQPHIVMPYVHVLQHWTNVQQHLQRTLVVESCVVHTASCISTKVQGVHCLPLATCVTVQYCKSFAIKSSLKCPCSHVSARCRIGAIQYTCLITALVNNSTIS